MRFVLAFVLGLVAGAGLEGASLKAKVEEAKAWEDALSYQAQEWIERAAGGGR